MEDQEIQETPSRLLLAMSTRKRDWAEFPAEDKYMAALEMRSRVLQAAARWGRAAAEVRGTDREIVAAQELTLMLAPLANYLDGLLATLGPVKTGEALLVPPVARRGEDTETLKAFPWGKVQTWLSLLGWALSTEVTIGRQDHSGSAARRPPPAGGEGELVLVSGAGYGPVELLAACVHAAFVQGAVVGLALPPRLAPLQLLFEYIMTPLAQHAFFASFVVDGVEATVPDLADLPGVDRLHLVGFTPEAVAELLGGAPTPVTISGSVHGPSPTIVVPGKWTGTQMKHNAFQLTEAFAYAGSAAPHATRLVVLPADWEQADELISVVKRELKDYRRPPALEDGMEARQAEFVEAYGDRVWTSPARPVSDLPAAATPAPAWSVAVLDGAPDKGSALELALLKDPRAPFLTFVKVSEPDLASYLEAAVALVNTRVRGAFAANVVAQNKLDKASRALVDKALDDLEYGFVGLNMPPLVAPLAAQAHWGAYAGADGQAVDAGFRQTSVAGNALMLRGVRKSVSRLPFESFLHQLPPEHFHTLLRTARTTAVSLVDGLRGFWRGINDKTTIPGQDRD